MGMEEEQVSRRKFLKMLGLGSLSLGALSFLPSAASKLTIGSDSISIDGNSFLSGQGISGASQVRNFVLDRRSSAPSNPKVGQMWYRTDLD